MHNKRIPRSCCTVFGVVLLTMLCCAMRDDESGTRDNPYDAGGSDWTVDAPPEVSITFEPLWADFNHADSTGSKQVSISISDRNFPFDTVTATPAINGQCILRMFIAAPVETTLLIDNLYPSRRYPCDIGTSDLRGVSTPTTCTLVTSADVPPYPPRPTITPGSKSLSITWQTIPGAASYSVYSADRKNGPYTLKRTVSQPESGPVIVIDTPPYTPRYYRFASSNNAGISFLRDTLPGRIYYAALTPPSFSGVSKGTYKDYIYLSYSGSINRAEIYRSIHDTLSFRFIDTLPAVSAAYTPRNYHDSITTDETCYYRMCIVDQQGRSSRPGPIDSGYLQRIAAPGSLTLTAYNDYLRLTWPAPAAASAATYYRVYRSDRSCTENMVPIDSVFTCNYQDTTTDARVYYYFVRSVDAGKRESPSGTCVSGRVQILPAPLGINASDGLYLDRIVLSWSPVNGAAGYIILRGQTTDISGMIALDTVTSTTFNDSVSALTSFYYRVAAFNARGTGQNSAWVSGRLVAPPQLNVGNNYGYIGLTWPSQSGALRYYLYRAEDSTNFYIVDSTTLTYYNDTVNDFNLHFYRMAILTSDGKSTPGVLVYGQSLLGPPSGLTAVALSYGIRLSWNSVPAAEKYYIYRLTAGSYTLYKIVTDTMYVDSMQPVQQYSYRVSTIAAGKESSKSNTITAGDINAGQTPLMPVNMSVGGYPSYIKISWSMNQTTIPVKGFYLYRSTSQSGPFSCIDTVSGMEYNDTVPDSLVFFYKVAAFNDRGTGPQTAAYPGKSSPPPLTPAAPVNVRVTGKVDYIEITWTMSASTVPVNAYNIYRSSSANGTFTRIFTVQSLLLNDSVYDTSVYYYKIDAFNSNGSSPTTPAYSGKCTALSHAPLAPRGLTSSQGSHTGGIALSWSPSTGATGYRIYRAPTDTFNRDIVLRNEVSTTSCFDSATSDSMYFYKVRAYNNGGEGKYCDTTAIGFRTPSAVPHTPVNSYTSGLVDGIYIGWENPSTSIGITGYAIYRSLSSSGPFTRITTLKTIGYKDFPPAVGTRFWYYITAENQKGESAPSGTVSGSIPNY